MQIIAYERLHGMYADIGSSLAMSLAIDNKNRISPVPAELYCSYLAKGRNSVEPPPKVKPVTHGEWTLLICQERKVGGQAFAIESSVVRHCLVTRNAAGNLMSYTLDDSLKLTNLHVDAGQLAAEFHSQFSTPGVQTAVGHCQFEEAEVMIKATDVYNVAIRTAYDGRLGDMLAAIRARDGMS